MIQRRTKRRTPAVVIITCTVKVISVPAPKVGGVSAAFENETEMTEKRRQLLGVVEENREKMMHREKVVVMAHNGAGGTDHKGDNDGGTESTATQHQQQQGGQQHGRGRQHQQQQLLDSKSAENVRIAVEKMRHKEEESLRARANDVYSKEFVPTKYAKHSAEYGRPPPGSLTEMRANKASRHIAREMLQLCEVIEEHGHRRRGRSEPKGGVGAIGRVVISFGDLFNIYQFISDKVVGMLLRARKHGMVDFEGEMLFQRRDEAKLITLLISHEQIQQALNEFAK